MMFNMVDSQGETVDRINAHVDVGCRIAVIYGTMMPLDDFMEVYEGLASEYPKPAPSFSIWKLRYERDLHERVGSYYDGLEEYELW